MGQSDSGTKNGGDPVMTAVVRHHVKKIKELQAKLDRSEQKGQTGLDGSLVEYQHHDGRFCRRGRGVDHQVQHDGQDGRRIEAEKVSCRRRHQH